MVEVEGTENVGSHNERKVNKQELHRNKGAREGPQHQECTHRTIWSSFLNMIRFYFSHSFEKHCCVSLLGPIYVKRYYPYWLQGD